MALIHEMLYQSENLAEVKYSQYIHGLVSHYQDTYFTDSRNISFQIDVEDISLSIDHAIPCGLILNELVSNALKYAFPAGQKGVIRIDFFRHDDAYNLQVQDDGIGLPDDVDFPSSNTLGLQLVNALVQQLGGEVSLKRAEGTGFTISFNGAE
jgi:two-component sensor histidine kinase